MKDNINYEAPEDWGVSSEDTWVSFEELKDNGAPILEGRDVVGFIEFAQIKLAPNKPPGATSWRSADGKPVALNPSTKRWQYVRTQTKPQQKPKTSPAQRMEQARKSGKWKGPIDKETPEDKPEPKAKKEAPAPKPQGNKEKTTEKKSSKLTGTSSANEQRKKVLEGRGLNPDNFFDQFKERYSKKLGGNPKLSEAANRVADVLGLFIDGDGKRLSGDTVKEGKKPQDVKQFSFEYVIGKDGSMTQRDPSAEGEQRAFRDFGELKSITEGPVKQALLAAGLSEEDLNEHPPEKPGRGATPEQKQKYKKDLEDYQTRERKRNKIADEISSEVIQKHLQKAQSEGSGSPLDFFKDLDDKEQEQVVDAMWSSLPPTLTARFTKMGNPRKTIFGGYDEDRNPIYVKSPGTIRGKAMLKKYLQQGGIDTYTLDNVLMSPFALTFDHVKPEARGGGDHPDNGAYTRAGLNTHLSDNNFLWLYRQAKGERERLASQSSDPIEQEKIYNDAQKAAYTSQFGTSVALSSAGTGANLSTKALQNSSGNLTGNLKKDLKLIASSLSEEDAEELAPGSSLDPASKEVQEFIKKKSMKLVGLAYFGTDHPNAASPSEKSMSAQMKELLWSGVSNKIKEGASLEDISSQVTYIKNNLATALLEGSKAGERYGSKVKANTSSEAFSEGISALSSFLGRDVQESEIQFIRKQF